METSTINSTLKPGTKISSNDIDNPIASWPAEKGGFYAKIYFYNGSDVNEGQWQAVSNAEYQGQGLIVFLKRQPAFGQKLKIIKVSTRVAFAEIV